MPFRAFMNDNYDNCILLEPLVVSIKDQGQNESSVPELWVFRTPARSFWPLFFWAAPGDLTAGDLFFRDPNPFSA